MKFELDQRFAAPPHTVAAAYADPDLYRAFGALPKMTAPEVVSHRAEGDLVTMEVRYHFDGDLSPAARAVLDPDRLSWVEHAVHDLAALTTTFTMVPDHYADRFRCRGTYRFEADGDGARRHGQGDITVRALLVGRAVENAIISGLREHLDDEISVVEAFLNP